MRFEEISIPMPVNRFSDNWGKDFNCLPTNIAGDHEPHFLYCSVNNMNYIQWDESFSIATDILGKLLMAAISN